MSSDEERKTNGRSVKGDQTVFWKLYESNRNRIAATIAQRTRETDDVENLVQISFIRVFTSLRNFRCETTFFNVGNSNCAQCMYHVPPAQTSGLAQISDRSEPDRALTHASES